MPNATQMTSNHKPIGWSVGMAIVAGMVGPFVLWPVEQLLPWPVWVEEGYKLWLVWLVLRGTRQNRAFWVFLAGLAFGLSETMLYLINFMQNGNLGDWGWRLVTAVPMHVITCMVTYGGFGLGLGPLGIIPAGLIHMWFNFNI